MKHKALPVAAALAALCLVACGGAGSDRDDGRDEDGATEEKVFDDMVHTKDRAKAVEGVTMEHKRDIDEAIEESETGETESGE